MEKYFCNYYYNFNEYQLDFQGIKFIKNHKFIKRLYKKIKFITYKEIIEICKN